MELLEPGQITRLLHQHLEGEPEAFERLVPLVYDRLRALARRQLRRLRPGQTLDTTALVHEAYLQLVDETGVSWQDRSHFYAITARAMRRIIVDHLRHRHAAKRGGGQAALTLDAEVLAGRPQGDAELALAVDRALEVLSSFNERLTRLVECRFFAGMTEEETAEALGVSLRTVQRDWMRAKAWLRKELK
jgi:RNA polymerase sigma factor (TIGR02999 family)